MLKMVDGTGIIGVDMVCPLGGTVSPPQPPNYDRVELEGAGMLVLPNSLDAPLEGLELGGKTEQVQTTGKNLFDTSFAKNKENYKEVTIAGSVIYAIELSLKPNTKYAFQCVIKSVPTTMNVGNSTIRYVVSDGQKRVITTNEDGKLYIGFSGNPDGEIHKIGVSIVDIQVEESTTVTPYEPYTGGKPSPSPEYPQEIKNSGKWNEEKQKYEVDVKVTGKNLLNLQKEPDVKGTYQGWKVGNGEPLTLGVKDKGNNADIKGCYIGFSYQGSEPNGAIWVVDNGVIKAYPQTQRKAYVSIYPNNETTVKKLTERFDIQCELGNVATPYQPYKEQTLTLTSDRPLTKWDRLVEQGGQIGWLYATKKHVVTGSEHFISGGVNYYTGSSVDLYFNVMDATGSQCIVKNLSDVPSIWHNKDAEGFRVNGSQFHIRLKNTRLSVSDDATKDEKIAAYKTYLVGEHEKGTPYEIVYQSLEPEFVPLPQSEQSAIRALKTYYPTTVITADGGELDPDIKVTYRKEI